MPKVAIHRQSTCGQSEDQPKPPGVTEAELLAGIEKDTDVLMCLVRLGLIHQGQPAAHSQMYHEGRSLFHVRQKVLGAPVSPEDPPVHKPAAESLSVYRLP